jgi:hypothetical protein
VANLFATACDPSYGITAFRCDPSNPTCPSKYGDGTYVCCSDDPAAIDLAAPNELALPNYATMGGTGIPLFSAEANSLSSWGFCIETAQVPIDAGIASPGPGLGCPKPCNPTWEATDITAVCGAGTSCCATVEIEESDCALDPDTQCWRPVTGGDIMGLGGADVSDWSSSDHATHQDPAGGGCDTFVMGQAAAISAAGLTSQEARVACFRKLSVANQRGFCQGPMECPLANPLYRDACEQINDREGRTNCG